MTRIGLDMTLLTRQGTGISRVILELLQYFAENARDHEFAAFIRADARQMPLPAAPNFEYRHVPTWGGRYSRTLWLFTMAATEARRAGVQAWYSANYYVPFRLDIPVAVHVADIAHAVVPERFSPATRVYYNLLIRHAVRTANRILVPTQTVARQLAARYPAARDRIVVTSHGLRSDFLGLSGEFRDFAQRANVILAPGGSSARKNLDLVIEAFSLLGPRMPGYRLQLYGPGGRLHPKAMTAWRRSPCRERIDFLGFLPDEELHRRLRTCRALVFPSLDEGFGLPILEAMAVRTPVLCSDIPVHREVAGDAAAFFHPRKAEELETALRAVLTDGAHWRRLVTAGIHRSAAFTWARCAETTLAAITAPRSGRVEAPPVRTPPPIGGRSPGVKGMKRLCVIGSRGAGKTTLASRLGPLLGIEVTELDGLYWRPGWVPTPEPEWQAIQRRLVARPAWILDGNEEADRMAVRLAAADTVILLDLPPLLCTWQVLKRRLTRHRTASPAWRFVPAELGPIRNYLVFSAGGLIKWIWMYRRQQLPQVLKVLTGDRDGRRIVVLRDRSAIQQFLDGLEAQLASSAQS